MDIMDFPFLKLSPDDLPRPWLPITIKNPHTGKKLQTYGLIDTGADECAIPASFASLLGHDLLKGATKEVATGNGITMAYGHTVCIEAGSFEIEDIVVDFLPNVNCVLLGVCSFLSNFELTVNYKDYTFSL